MESLYAVLVALIAVGVAAGVSLFTKSILDKQTRVAAAINKLAGVLAIRTIKEGPPSASLAQVLAERLPVKRLSILAVSGRTVLQPDLLANLLDHGVEVKVMLLDPQSRSSLREEHPWLAQETGQTLADIENLVRESHGALEIRVYPWPQMQMLMFIDDERLFVSSYFPISSESRLVYEIGNSEQSLYRLYVEAFEFLWRHAEVYPNRRLTRG